jgi:putative transposase
MARGFLYLVVVMDWCSRYVLAWRLSNTMDTSFCLDALEDALRKGRPEIFNTDQGVQFTSAAFTGTLQSAAVRISMDGRGRWLDNVFVERLWRSLKYEEVHLKAYIPTASRRASASASGSASTTAHQNTDLSMLLKEIGFVDRDAIPRGASSSAAPVP